jgi:hypothetical protein
VTAVTQTLHLSFYRPTVSYSRTPMAPAKLKQKAAAKAAKATKSKKVKPAGEAKADGETRALWSTEDETELLLFLIEHLAEAGDRSNFKTSTFKAASLVLDKMRTKGGPKTAKVCKNKWMSVHVVLHHGLIFFTNCDSTSS